MKVIMKVKMKVKWKLKMCKQPGVLWIISWEDFDINKETINSEIIILKHYKTN